MSSNNSISAMLQKKFLSLKAQIIKVEHFKQMKTSGFKVVFKKRWERRNYNAQTKYTRRTIFFVTLI